MTNSRESLQPTDDGWAPCAPGTFQALKAASHTSNRLADFKPYAVGLCLGVLLAVVAVAVKSVTPVAKPQRALTCAEVMPLLDAYAAQELDNEVAVQVREHLSICAHCQAEFEQLAGGSYRALWHDAPPRPLVAMVIGTP